MRLQTLYTSLLLVCFFPALLPAEEEPLSMLGRNDVRCPVCQEIFTTVRCVQTNVRAGVDRDLFARPLGPNPEFYRISTCPHCGYSGYITDFIEAEIDPAVRRKVLEKPGLNLPKDFGPQSDPRELDAAERYALAIQCYQWRNRPAEALAWLHLRASWIARDKGSALPPDPRLQKVMQYIERFKPHLEKGGNQVDVELKTVTLVADALAAGRFNRYQKPYVELAMALILRRHGENIQALHWLDQLRDYKSFSSTLREGIDRMLNSIDREQKHQQQAISYFEKALTEETIAERNRGSALYLLGELNRRLGHCEKAVTWYEKALQAEPLPKKLAQWSREQKAWCAPGLPTSKTQ
jgi:uncharacterized protein (DUF2225 family)